MLTQIMKTKGSWSCESEHAEGWEGRGAEAERDDEEEDG